jgi:hypothetical protein
MSGEMPGEQLALCTTSAISKTASRSLMSNSAAFPA